MVHTKRWKPPTFLRNQAGVGSFHLLVCIQINTLLIKIKPSCVSRFAFRKKKKKTDDYQRNHIYRFFAFYQNILPLKYDKNNVCNLSLGSYKK